MYSIGESVKKFVEYIAIAVIILITWSVLERFGIINSITLPAPETIIKTCVENIKNGRLFNNLAISMVRVVKGYCLAAVLGISFGILLGFYRRLNYMTDLIVQIIKPIPPIAWIPLAIIWFGIGEMSKVFLIFLGGFFTILVNVIDGIHQVDGALVEVSDIMETPRYKHILYLVLPSALPNIFTGLRTGLGSCWMCVVAAELVAATSGIGYMISNARQFSKTDVVIVGMLAIGVSGKIMDSILKTVERRVIKWN